MAELFSVIVELFPINWSGKHSNNFLDEASSDKKELINLLKKSTGIYAFYNSELELIYIGKTRSDLWFEMKNALAREMPHYKRYRVDHPKKAYVPTKSGHARKLQLRNVMVWEASSYFSAYSVDDDYIDSIEQLLIRIAPNDILNRRMEGNGSLKIHTLQDEE